MTDSKRYEELASKWLNGTITVAEKVEFSVWYHANQDDQLDIPKSFAGDEEELRERILAKLREKTARADPNGRIKPGPRWLIAVAAAMLLFVSIGFYVWLDTSGEGAVTRLTQQDVKPGSNRATLTLADGRTIELSDDHAGIVIGDEIMYADGTVISAPDAKHQGPGNSHQTNLDAQAPTLMSIATPKGGQYQITLPDGSKVWLNSASSLKYPTKFTHNSRAVELEGEAYFEVAQQVIGTSGIPETPKLGGTTRLAPKIPFIVKARNQEVEVLGTQFNINAYEDEPVIKTTLVEGGVRVRRHGISQGNHQAKTLKPGEQAVFTDTEIDIHKVDVEEFTAWKDGYFYFNDANIYTVMKQLSRWYDIDVRYEIESHNDLFVGKVPKDVNLTTTLNILKSAGVNFELQDRLLVVLPNNN